MFYPENDVKVSLTQTHVKVDLAGCSSVAFQATHVAQIDDSDHLNQRQVHFFNSMLSKITNFEEDLDSVT